MFYISKTKSDIGQNRAGGGAGEAYSAPHPKKNSSAVKFASQSDAQMRTDTQIPVLFPVKALAKPIIKNCLVGDVNLNSLDYTTMFKTLLVLPLKIAFFL